MSKGLFISEELNKIFTRLYVPLSTGNSTFCCTRGQKDDYPFDSPKLVVRSVFPCPCPFTIRD